MIARLILLAVLISVCNWAAATEPQAPAQDVSAQSADIEVFVREGCTHCAHAKEFLAKLKREQPGLRIVIRDVLREPAALERLKRLAGEQHAVSVPAFVVGGQLIVGFSDESSTGQLIRDRLASRTNLPVFGAATGCMAAKACDANAPEVKPATYTVAFAGVSISPERLGLPLFTLAMGLLDGFNPCSMWVLILMISLLAPMHNRLRMFAIAGTFVAVEGLAYFVFMAAWLNIFMLIGLSRASEIIIAAIALLAAAINLQDFLGLNLGISLSIPAAAKPGIYARLRRILQAKEIAAAMLGTVVLAILVQIVEFMCTSGFPALFTRILTLRQLDTVSYYGYLLLYDLAYMFDDVVVLAIGIITLSQRRLQEREGRRLKLASGLVMAGLGVYLLVK